MDNHVHHVVIPAREHSLAEGIGQLHHDFARWQNIQRNTSGHLWQNRFYSCPVEEDRVWGVLSYVELNPVRARMVENAWDWEWSSARAHVSNSDPSGLLDMNYWLKTFNDMTWRIYLKEREAEKSDPAEIRRVTAMGRFLGSDETAKRMERELGIRLLPRRRDRKRNPAAELVKLVK
jgi:putative transposase